MKHIGMIYENDIPDDKTDYSSSYWYRYFNHKPFTKVDTHRFKPNGITDNREEWRSKNCERLAEMEAQDEFIR